MSSESHPYIFCSERLGFRNWVTGDLDAMAAINADPVVMEYFPSIQDREQTLLFIERMQRQFEDSGYCYFATERLHTKEFIGFIGLSQQDFESAFTPCIDIGWRLKQSAWNKGFATEGALRCLEFAFTNLGIEKIMSMAAVLNVRSQKVMLKAGMTKCGEFIHPKLANDERLRKCVLYEIVKKEIKTASC